MAFLSTLTRLGAAAAITFAVMGPVAMADDRGRGDRGGHHDRGKNWGNDNRGDRGHDRGRDHGRDHGRDRGRDQGRDHGSDHGRDRNRDWGHNNNRHRDWNDRNRQVRHKTDLFKDRHRHYSRPRTVHRYYHSTPSYARPHYRPRVVYHYDRGYYHNGYRIGSYYSYRPNTIIIRDYGMYGLYAPPPGHHWVRDPYGQDAVLTSIATGAIIGLAVGILAN